MRVPFLSLLLCGFVQAKEPRLGIHLGPNLAGASVSNPTVDVGRRFGWMVGTYVEAPVGAVSFRPEFHYVQKGGETTLGNLSGTFRFDYLESALLIKLGLEMEEGVLEVFVILGPTFAFKLLSRVETLELVNGNSFEWGAEGGAGFQFPIAASLEGGFTVRYSMGLSNTLDSATQWNSRALKINAFICLPLRRFRAG